MGCIFRPEALSWEDIDGGRGEMTMEAIRNFISEYCYRDSNGGGQGKTVNGTYTVKYYYPGRKCGVHIDGLGWVPESGCTVIG